MSRKSLLMFCLKAEASSARTSLRVIPKDGTDGSNATRHKDTHKNVAEIPIERSSSEVDDFEGKIKNPANSIDLSAKSPLPYAKSQPIAQIASLIILLWLEDKGCVGFGRESHDGFGHAGVDVKPRGREERGRQRQGRQRVVDS
ncbi:MAG: hypothetical protein Q9165_008681 [Trypethelium subeluteriae]